MTNEIDVVSIFQQALNAFDKKAKKDGISISAKPNRNYRYVGQLLDGFYVLDFFHDKNSFPKHLSGSLTDLLEGSGSLQKTCDELQKECDVLHTQIADARNAGERLSKVELVSTLEQSLDGMIMIRNCFQLLRTKIGSKQTSASEPLFTCALCWKRVQVLEVHAEKSQLVVPRRDSTFYCSNHLPKKSEHLYNQDRTSLFSAMRSHNNRYLYELQYYEEISETPPPPTVYKWLGSFAPSTSSVLYSLQDKELENASWQTKANNLIEYSADIYENAYNQLKSLNSSVFKSSVEWLIDGVVSALAGSADKDEVAFWKKSEDKRVKLSSFYINANSNDPSVLFIDDESFRLALSVIRRYEAYQIVKCTKQPRGGGNAKDQQLRARIFNARSRTPQISVKNIAKAENLSTSRIYKILEEF